jgi:hypothetical protein
MKEGIRQDPYYFEPLQTNQFPWMDRYTFLLNRRATSSQACPKNLERPVEIYYTT